VSTAVTDTLAGVPLSSGREAVNAGRWMSTAVDTGQRLLVAGRHGADTAVTRLKARLRVEGEEMSRKLQHIKKKGQQTRTVGSIDPISIPLQN
jgi:hypothetical protein